MYLLMTRSINSRLITAHALFLPNVLSLSAKGPSCYGPGLKESAQLHAYEQEMPSYQRLDL